MGLRLKTNGLGAWVHGKTMHPPACDRDDIYKAKKQIFHSFFRLHSLSSLHFSNLSLLMFFKFFPPMSFLANLHLLRWERRRQVGSSGGGWPAGAAAHHAGTLFSLFFCFESLYAYPFLFSIFLLLLPFDTFSVLKLKINKKV